MLKELHIKNVAVIDEVTIEFNSGFNVLTGETGAGKSILIDSINMALGDRVSKDLIRTGEDRAVVDVIFEVSNPYINEKLAEYGVENDEEYLVISRQLSHDGKSTCRINGRIFTTSVIKEIGKLLINIHGQNDNQALLSPQNHIDFLDEYGIKLKMKSDYKDTYDKVCEITKRILEMDTDEKEKSHRLDLLKFQMDEIAEAKLKVGEEEKLEERRNYLANIERIINCTEESYVCLYDGDEGQAAAYDLLSTATRRFSEVCEFDKELNSYYNSLSSMLEELGDIARDIRGYVDNIDYERGELSSIEERLNTIYNLKRKYGNSIEEILEYYDKISIETNNIVRSDEIIIDLKNTLTQLRKELEDKAKTLSDCRKELAKNLEEKIMYELETLDMQKVRFEISITQVVADGEIQYNSKGFDKVEFLISTNAGEGLKPLSKIASGGEMSRIMLAMRTILANADIVETLIFDEIDTGVSGRAAQKIAEKINRLSRSKQVLSITHLAQIASMADTHYLIKKDMVSGKTSTSVIKLSLDMRKEELARIIGGVKITDLTLKNAQEMLDLANSIKGEEANG